jgi:hypothetical protein
METARATVSPDDQRTVVVTVDFFVAVVSPIGETVVPLEVDPVVVVTTPLTSLVFRILVSVETTGAGMTGVVVIVVVLEDEDCAWAAPDNSVTASVAARRGLIIFRSPEIRVERRSLDPMVSFKDIAGCEAVSETTQSAPDLSVPAAVAAVIRMVFAMRPVTITATWFDNAAGQRERNQQ